MWPQRQTPRSSVAASETFGYQPGPTYGNRFSLQPSQSPGPAARRPRAQRRPPGTGWAGGRGRWPARCACSAPRPRRRTARLYCTPASKTRGGSLGLWATRLSRLVGCALSLSVFSLWQSPHSACKVCTLPAKACLTGTTWSSSQAPAVSPQPRSARLPFCAARVFCLSAFPLRLQQLQEDLVRQAGQALAWLALWSRLSRHVLLRFVLAPRGPAPPFRFRRSRRSVWRSVRLLRLLRLRLLFGRLHLIIRGQDITRTTKTTRKAGRRCRPGQAEAHVPQGNRAPEGHEAPVV